MENHPYVMESSVLVHECTLRNIDLVAAFFLLMVQILLLAVMKHSLPVHESCWNFGLVQIACVLNRDGKFTPRWLKQFLEFSSRSISLAQFGFQISPSVMDHSLPINSSSC